MPVIQQTNSREDRQKEEGREFSCDELLAHKNQLGLAKVNSGTITEDQTRLDVSARSVWIVLESKFVDIRVLQLLPMRPIRLHRSCTSPMKAKRRGEKGNFHPASVLHIWRYGLRGSSSGQETCDRTEVFGCGFIHQKETEIWAIENNDHCVAGRQGLKSKTTEWDSHGGTRFELRVLWLISDWGFQLHFV